MNNKIINPVTGRAVNRYGPIGQQVLKNRRTQRGGSKKQSPRRNSRRKSQRRTSRSKTGGGSNQSGNSWIYAVAEARKQLGIKGFQAVRKGTPLYKRAKKIQSGGGPWPFLPRSKTEMDIKKQAASAAANAMMEAEACADTEMKERLMAEANSLMIDVRLGAGPDQSNNWESLRNLQAATAKVLESIKRAREERVRREAMVTIHSELNPDDPGAGAAFDMEFMIQIPIGLKSPEWEAWQKLKEECAGIFKWQDKKMNGFWTYKNDMNVYIVRWNYKWVAIKHVQGRALQAGDIDCHTTCHLKIPSEWHTLWKQEDPQQRQNPTEVTDWTGKPPQGGFQPKHTGTKIYMVY